MKHLYLCAALALLAACHTDADIRPAHYDELAMAPGHWEWESSTYLTGRRSPATVGYARQLTFGADNHLTFQPSNGPATNGTYELSAGPLPRCGLAAGVPLVTFATHEPQLPNNDRKTYRLSTQDSRQLLTLTGEAACVDGGAVEQYHWVPE